MKKFLSVISFLAAMTVSIAAFATSSSKPTAMILQEICIKCEVCIGVCPNEAIKSNGDIIVLNPNACDGCGACMDSCPAGAIWLAEVS